MKVFGLKIPFTGGKSEPVNDRINFPMMEPQANYYRGGESYDGSYRSDGSKWVGGISGSGNNMVYNHSRMRTVARNAYQDSVQAHSLVTRWADSISDTGLTLDCNPSFGILGITPEKAEKWSSDVEQRFSIWSKDKRACRSEVMNFNQSHRLYQLDDKRDGENFIRLYYNNDKSLLNPVQFEFIDPSQIRGEAFTYAGAPYGNDDGIIRDERGRETNYKIWTSKVINGKYEYKHVDVPRLGKKSKKIMMIHSFAPEFPGQERGFSNLAHILQEFQNLTDFTSAQIKKAINQSNIVFTMENSLQDPSNPSEDMPISIPGSGSMGVAVENDPTGEGAGITNEVECHSLNEVNLNVPGSTAYFNTKQGDKLIPVKDTSPSSSFETFKDAFMTDICASTGMPLEVLQMKFNQNYSASRAALLMFWRVAQIWREEMASDYLNPVFEMWLNEEIAAGRVIAQGWNDPILRAAWLNCTWIGSPMPNIDPQKTAKAEELYLRLQATTNEKIARNYNGSDAKSNAAKNEKFFESIPILNLEPKQGETNG